MPGKRILIIDDSRSARAFLARMLERHGLEVDGVGSAEEGHAYLQRQLPDALFLDHLLPGTDGFQVLAALRADARTAALPVMMYTSQQGEAYLAEARRLGAAGVLPKQLRAIDVVAALELLKLQPAEAELAQVTTVLAQPAAPTVTPVATVAPTTAPTPTSTQTLVPTVVPTPVPTQVPVPAPVPPPMLAPAATVAPLPVAVPTLPGMLPPAAFGLPRGVPAVVPAATDPAWRALLESLAREQGNAIREQLATQLTRQIDEQVGRLFAELRALRRDLANAQAGISTLAQQQATRVDPPAPSPPPPPPPPVPGLRMLWVTGVAAAALSVATGVIWLLRPVFWPPAPAVAAPTLRAPRDARLLPGAPLGSAPAVDAAPAPASPPPGPAAGAPAAVPEPGRAAGGEPGIRP